MTLDDFLTLTLPERVAWLHSKEGPRGYLSHDKFAEILGTSRQTVINWEAGDEPKRYAEALAEFSDFPAEAFTRREAEPLVKQMYDLRLARLEEQVRDLPTKADLRRGLETLRKAIQSQAIQGNRRGSGKN